MKLRHYRLLLYITVCKRLYDVKKVYLEIRLLQDNQFMLMRLIFILALFELTSTVNNHEINNPLRPITALDTIPGSQRFETLCDSVYKNKNYKIIQDYFPDGIKNDTNNNNIIFTFTKVYDSNINEIFKDTIFSSDGDIEFRDFNGDNVRDILIQNISDVRSNWTYYLYLVDTTHDILKKIKGFEEIKRPNYLPEYDLIDNYVMSGTIWTSFYKIEKDSIKDFEIVIYDDQTDNGNYERNYNKAIKSILKKEKNKR